MPGKLMETVTLDPVIPSSRAQKGGGPLRLRLEQYYSYAYAGDL